MKIELGTHRKVDPRAVFSSDKEVLISWLAEHLDLLGSAMGMDLELVPRIHAAHDPSADIVARESGRGRTVVVQTQLDSTDATNLGKLIMCAGGEDAYVVAWVSSDFRQDHRRALEWLNRRGPNGAEFYAIGFDLFRIDDSKPGIELRLLAAPSGTAPAALLTNGNGHMRAPESAAAQGEGKGASQAEVKVSANAKAAAESGHAADPTAADHGEAYRRFFQKLVDELREQRQLVDASVAQRQNWYSFPTGTNGMAYSIWFSTAGRVRAELYIDLGSRELNRLVFDRLRQYATAIEKEFGEKLQWDLAESGRACTIGTDRLAKIDDPPETLEKVLRWALDRLARFRTVFGPRLPGLAKAVTAQRQGAT